MSKQEPDSTSSRSQEDAERRSWSFLRLLRSDPSAPIENPELRMEFQRLFELLERIEDLAERELQPSPSPSPPPHAAAYKPQQEPDSVSEPEPPPEPGSDFGEDLVAFDPSELDRFEPAFSAEEHAEPEIDSSERASSQQVSQSGQEAGAEPKRESTGAPFPFAGDDSADDTGSENGVTEESPADEDQHLERWWVNFNGDVSLDRLARLRKTLSESPFTFEARFEEITDGLIVLRVVTDKHLTLEQVEWVVWQVMQSVGLDRNAAIISRS